MLRLSIEESHEAVRFCHVDIPQLKLFERILHITH